MLKLSEIEKETENVGCPLTGEIQWLKKCIISFCILSLAKPGPPYCYAHKKQQYKIHRGRMEKHRSTNVKNT